MIILYIIYKMYSPLEQFEAIPLFNYFLSKKEWINSLFFIDFSFFHIIEPFVILSILLLVIVPFVSYFNIIFLTTFQRFFDCKLNLFLI